MVESRGTASSTVRRELRCFAELFALNGFAIAQPLLDIFGRAPDQFLFRGAGRGEILGFCLVIVVVPPLLLWGLEVLVGLASRRIRDHLHIGLVGALLAVFAAQILVGPLPRIPALVVAVLIGGFGGFLRQRTRGLGLWLRYASPAPIVFAALFLFASSVSPLMKGPVGALGVPVKEPVPVVMVVFDELPLAALLDADGDIDADLHPNFARLAATSDWFRQATTVSNFTWHAVPSLVTGVLPQDQTVPTAASHPENLFTLLGGAMPVHASETVTGLCSAAVCDTRSRPTGGLRALLGDARDVLEQRLSPRAPERDPVAGLVEALAEPAEAVPSDEDAFTGRVSGRFHDFLETFEEPEPGLHYLHMLLPHIPYRFLPGGITYEAPDPDFLPGAYDVFSENQPIVDLARQRQLLQTMYVDDLLGALLDDLDSRDLFDDAMIVVVSDHGSSFEPGGNYRGLADDAPIDDRGAAQILWVPFFVKRPGQVEGSVSEDPVQTIDVVPTIAEVLDVRVPWDLDGRSVYAGGSGDPETAGYYESHLGESGGMIIGDRRSVPRDLGWEVVLDMAAGRFAPASDGALGVERLYRIGPRPDLVGATVTDMAGLEPVEARFRFGGPGTPIEPHASPSLMVAEVPLDAGEPVAVAVDGRIRATATTWVEDGPTSIAVMIPPEAFESDSYEVDLYRIS